MKKLFLVLFLLALPFKPSQAQFLDPDRCWNCFDKKEHFVAGAGIDLLARGPWVAKNFRNSLPKRIGWVVAVGASYETLQYFEAKQNGNLGKPGFGFGLLDLGADIAGGLFLEGIWSIGKKLF